MSRAVIPVNEGKPQIVILAKPGCHLCEAVEEELRFRLPDQRPIVVNIEPNSPLYNDYVLRIPVVKFKGEVVFEASMMDPKGEWKERLWHLLKST
jgi:hypothetical protein